MEINKELKKILEDDATLMKYSNESFEKIDKNKSGFIEDTEFIKPMLAIMKEVYDKDITEDAIKYMMKGLDRDHDGKLSKEEFSKAFKIVMEELAKKA